MHCERRYDDKNVGCQGGSFFPRHATPFDRVTQLNGLSYAKNLQGNAIKTFEGHTKQVFCVCIDPQTNLVASGSFDNHLRIWSVKSGDCIRKLPAHTKPVTAVDFNQSGKLIVTGSFDGLCRIWETSTGKLLQTIAGAVNHPISHVEFSPNSLYILSSSLNSEVILWDFKTGEKRREYKGHKITQYCSRVTFFAKQSDNQKENFQYLIGGSEDGYVYMWSVHNQTVVGKLQHSRDSKQSDSDVVLSIAGDPQGGYVASGSLGNNYSITVRKFNHKDLAAAQSGGENASVLR